MFVNYEVIALVILYQSRVLIAHTTRALGRQEQQHHLRAGHEVLTCSSTTELKSRFSLERQNELLRLQQLFKGLINTGKGDP